MDTIALADPLVMLFMFTERIVDYSPHESSKILGFSWSTTGRHLASLGHLTLQWTRDGSRIGLHYRLSRRSGGEPMFAGVVETPSLGPVASLVEEDSRGQPPPYNATSAMTPSNPDFSPHLSQRQIDCKDGSRHHHHPDEQAALQASPSGSPAPKLPTSPTPRRETSRTVLFDAAVDLEGGAGGSWDGSRGPNEPVYAGIGKTPALGSTVASVGGGRPPRAGLVEEDGPGQYPQYTAPSTDAPSHPEYQPPATPHRPRLPHLHRQSSAASRRSRALVDEQKLFWALPHAVRKLLWAWWNRVTWVAEADVVAYTMFNVFLPKFLETGTTLEPELSSASPKGLEDSLWDVVIFTIGGCPGAIPVAYSSQHCRNQLTATAMWAVLYGWNLGERKRMWHCLCFVSNRWNDHTNPGGNPLDDEPNSAFCVVMLKEEPRGASGPGGVEKEEGRPLAVH
ncbi:hypothetical protein BKA70DRAFT_1410681 [Coprinopsis sp. MPI-PUGE-AT-0042]|nr:hypothetical protein BKA70DRAFT_1410681 [Coprinopsis sp. MPI-PUGE-AT-0042]